MASFKWKFVLIIFSLIFFILFACIYTKNESALNLIGIESLCYHAGWRRKGEELYKMQLNGRQLLGFSSYNDEVRDKLEKLVGRKAGALDKELVEFVRSVMDEPAPPNRIKMSRVLMKTPQAREIDAILYQKKNGFFIEAGGYDGERSSNSIFFEKERQWTGLLVEPDPYFYTQLIGKNRKAWSINACISPFNYVSEIVFKDSLGGSGRIDTKKDPKGIFKVPCYPFATLMAALDISQVDYFSLDVEGAEGIILESIPFDKINISTLSVEYRHGSKQKYITLMKNRGYKMVKDLVVHQEQLTLWVDDFIFVK